MIRSKRIALSLAMLLLMWLPWAPPACGEGAVKSNLEVLTQLTTEVAGELISGFHGETGATLRIKLVPHLKSEEYEFLTNIFTAELTSRNFKTYSPGAEPPPEASQPSSRDEGTRAMELEYQALEFSLTYPKIFRSHLIGGKKVKRKAEVKIFAKLLDGADKSVVWVGEASRSYEDQFPYGARPEVEEGLFAFTKPPIEPTRWGRIIEPVVVSGIIVGLVYLFFSNQSDE